MTNKVLEQELLSYVNNFDIKDHHIWGKYLHSLNVAYLMQNYAQELDLDSNLAFEIGLLHDIGRFTQWSLYHTFNDSISIDHGSYGSSLLFEEGLIKNFTIAESHYAKISNAIINHNKYAVKKEDNDSYTKLIRDCDKLSILDEYLKIRIYDIKKSLSNTTIVINPEILLNMKKHLLSKYREVYSLPDEACYYMSYIFDINYDIIYLEVMKLINLMLHILEDGKELNNINFTGFIKVNDYVKDYKLEREKKIC